MRSKRSDDPDPGKTGLRNHRVNHKMWDLPTRNPEDRERESTCRLAHEHYTFKDAGKSLSDLCQGPMDESARCRIAKRLGGDNVPTLAHRNAHRTSRQHRGGAGSADAGSHRRGSSADPFLGMVLHL